MKRNDLILLAVILAMALFILFCQRVIFKQEGRQVQIMQNGKVTAVYSLYESKTVNIESDNGGENSLVIRDGTVRMSQANCPDKLCVYQREIKTAGENIICLPHKLSVLIQGGKESEIDAITQ